jgi:hypothetical protein
MGRGHDGKGGLAHSEGVREDHRKKDAIVRPMYAEILSIEWLAHLRVFRDYLKSVMFRNIEDIHQGLVKDATDLSTVLFDSPGGSRPFGTPKSQRAKGTRCN